ncbi:MAG TPA: TRIC cation channel family protein [Azospirillaceae bacterium]|nr:TRIC cation channel family protein [Azospirillaceae bacterium]HRQ79546.1 TRIC cation channel family protein [Azospirillaceae bacterium]
MSLSATFGEVVNAPWFLAVDLIGTAAFALSGITIARSEGYSIFGALVLAWLPALGGGLVMDEIAGRNPVGMLAQPLYMYAIIVVVLTARAFLWLIDQARGQWLFFFDIVQLYLKLARRLKPMTLLVVFDAVGLAGFTVTGVFTAIQFNCHPLELWGPTFAMLNACLGAVLRDVFRADAGNPILKGALYAEIALFWGLALTIAVQTLPRGLIAVAVIATLVGAPLTRLVAYRYNWRAPMY